MTNTGKKRILNSNYKNPKFQQYWNLGFFLFKAIKKPIGKSPDVNYKSVKT